MLVAWDLPVTRPTKDIDMLARTENNLESIRKMMASICQTQVDADGLEFDENTVTTCRIAEDALYEGVRASFTGSLGNARIAMQVDLGFSDVITPGPVALTYPTILDQPAPQLLAYNRETAIAEKTEAMIKLGELNSRMKDFFDVWSLCCSQSFDGNLLTDAVTRTFTNRETVMSSEAACFRIEFGTSSNRQTQWRAFIKRSQLTGLAPDLFEDTWQLVVKFLSPVMERRAVDSHWPAGGPWASP